MLLYNRRRFIQVTAATAALGIVRPWKGAGHSARKLSFSTLGCPAWTFQETMTFARSNGYQGLEFRGIHGELDLRKCVEFSPANISSSKQQMSDHQLSFVDLGSSAEMHHAIPAEREKQLGEAKAYIDLAHALGCPFIRVFPNTLPQGAERAATVERIVSALLELGDYAKGTGVSVLLESHGDCVASADLLYIMQQAMHPNTGMIWDVCNMWTVTKEAPADVYAKLKPYIRHTHIKDLKMPDGKIQYVEMGTGDSPIGDAVRLLDADDYPGYYSFEWEKLWHPEIGPSESALGHFPKQIQAFF